MWTTLRAADCGPLVVHVPYFINPATPEDDKHAFAIEILTEEMTRAAALGAAGVVTHFGDHRGSGAEAGRGQVVRVIKAVLAATPGEVRLLLENAAGEGGECGTRFDEIAQVIADCGADPRIGVCIDTAHSFAAGYDWREPGQTREIVDSLLRLFGRERLACFHLNDSKTVLGSGRDLHANLGKGEIGADCFATLCSLPELVDVPGILETPDKDPGARAADLSALLAWSGADGGGTER